MIQEADPYRDQKQDAIWPAGLEKHEETLSVPYL